jgi:hypothetical protein
MLNSESLKSAYDAMVRLWPITVEIYPTGNVAFIARPLSRGQRWNKAFSTHTFGSPEEAVRAAIEFCKGVQSGVNEDINFVGKIREETRERRKLARYGITGEEKTLAFEAKKLGIDVAGLLKREIERLTLANLQAKWGNPK